MLGMIDAGIGPSQLNSLLTALDIPAISFKTLKNSENDVRTAITNIADESCEQALLLEKQLTIEESELSLISLPEQ